MARAWINDGLTLSATVQPDKPFPEDDVSGDPVPVNIQFRPPLSDVLLRFEDSQRLPGPERVEALYQFLQEHLVEWDVQDDKNKTPSCKELANLKHVPPEYLVRMSNEIRKSIRQIGYVVKN